MLLRLSAALLALVWAPLVASLKFDIQAHPGHESARYERCIRNFVAKEQLVVVTAIIDGQRGDGQQLNMHVSADRSRKAPYASWGSTER
jgi:p24 family protein delta-1